MDPLKFILKQKNYETECDTLIKYFQAYGFALIKIPYFDSKVNSDLNKMFASYFEDRSTTLDKNGKIKDYFPETNCSRGFYPTRKFSQPDSFDYFRKTVKDMNIYPKSSLTVEPYISCGFSHFIEEEDSKHIYPPNIEIPDYPLLQTTAGKFSSNVLQNVIYSCIDMLQEHMNIKSIDIRKDICKGGENMLFVLCTDVLDHPANTPLFNLHYDRVFLNAHGTSTHPGLLFWVNREKPELVRVNIPEGYTLITVGNQLEWLTGGFFRCSFHEILNLKDSIDIAHKQKEKGESTYRVAKITFCYANNDAYIQPLKEFQDSQYYSLYSKLKANEFLDDRKDYLEPIYVKQAKITSI